MSMRISKLHIATFLAILFHFCGAVGMLWLPYREWFVAHTTVNLSLAALLLAWNQPEEIRNFLLFFLVAFAVGMGTEMVGVHTGRLFGHYSYGEVLGWKWQGVPLLIGLNWFVTVYCSGAVIGRLEKLVSAQMKQEGTVVSKHWWTVLSVVDGAILCVFFDWLMEPVAMKLGFWQWENGVVPLYNYVCWFVISIVLLAMMRLFSLRANNLFAVHLFIIQVLFFFALRTFL